MKLFHCDSIAKELKGELRYDGYPDERNCSDLRTLCALYGLSTSTADLLDMIQIEAVKLMNPILLRGLIPCRWDRSSRIAFYLDYIKTLGIPVPADAGGEIVVWPVQPLKVIPYGHQPTISEVSGEAELHTDSSYRSVPERNIALYCEMPASDGGGATTLMSFESIVNELRNNVEGRETEQFFLNNDIAFPVPDSFASTADAGVTEAVFARVFSEHVPLRFRRDLIESGCRLQKVGAARDTMHHLDILLAAMSRCQIEQYQLYPGDVILVNNHLYMHGRTDFSDGNRLLHRIRFN